MGQGERPGESSEGLLKGAALEQKFENMSVGVSQVRG